MLISKTWRYSDVLNNVTKLVTYVKDLFMQKCLKKKKTKKHPKEKPGQTAHKPPAPYRHPLAYQRKSSLQDIWIERWITRVLTRKQPAFAEYFGNEKWLQELAYFADVFHHMNTWTSLWKVQGKIFFPDKSARSKRKLTCHLARGMLEMFLQPLGLENEGYNSQILSNPTGGTTRPNEIAFSLLFPALVYNRMRNPCLWICSAWNFVSEGREWTQP